MTQGVANAPVQHYDPSIVHNGTTSCSKLVMSRNKPSLSIFVNLQYCEGEHKMISASQKKCKYCQYLVLVAKTRKEVPPSEKTTKAKMCHMQCSFVQ